MGGVVGWTRERRDKPAGIRTHMMVALGAATFVVLALEMDAQAIQHGSPARIDPTRVLQGVIGGIGFLGAGSIIQAKGRVSGVTTAASVWVCGALGVAAGLGAYWTGCLATLLGFITLTVSTRSGPKKPQLGLSEPPSASVPPSRTRE